MREVRTIQSKLRARGDGSKMEISGHASVFNVPTNLGDFHELVVPGAFARSLAEDADVLACVDHDIARIVGRSSAGTLRLNEDDKGLAFSCSLPNTTAGKDLWENVRLGNLRECSFAFTVRNDEDLPGQDFTDDECDGETDDCEPGSRIIMRRLRNLNLLDVSVVARPAYPRTDVGPDPELLSAGSGELPTYFYGAVVPSEVRARVAELRSRRTGKLSIMQAKMLDDLLHAEYSESNEKTIRSLLALMRRK